MILVDNSSLKFSVVHAFSSDFEKGRDIDKMMDISRHVYISSILGIQRKFKKEFGQIVLCLDSSPYWRTNVFPHYKANRKKGREESKIDWKASFNIFKELEQELVDIFPWKVVKANSAEGDDVIAALVHYLQDNETTSGGIFDEPQPSLIYAADADFKQLHRFKNVKQFNPIMKKWVAKPEPDFLVEKIIRGDGGDGVPSVLCPDDFFINEDTGRAKPVTKKVIERFKNGIGLADEEKRRFERNRLMIDLSLTPTDIRDEIVANYKTADATCDLQKIMNHLIQKRCRNLLNDIQAFKT